MGIEIKIAETKEELEKVYCLRYQIFCEEFNHLSPENFPNKLEKDKYDDLTTTKTFIAIKNNNIIASSRLVVQNNIYGNKEKFGLPLESQFDLSKYKNKDYVFAENSRAIALKEYRLSSIMFYVWKSVTQYANKNNITHFVLATHPKDIKMYSKLGFEVISDVVKYEQYNDHLAVVMLLPLKDMHEPYKSKFAKPEKFIKI